jgi:hypothetical protein
MGASLFAISDPLLHKKGEKGRRKGVRFYFPDFPKKGSVIGELHFYATRPLKS